MWSILLFTILCVSVHSQSGPGIIDARCPPNATPDPPLHLSNPNDCRSFFTCANGLAVPFDCPEGQHWSVSSNACDWPDRAKCEGTEGTACPPGNPTPPAVLPHETDCTRFYKCSWGVPHEINCPVGQHFAVAIGACDWPDRANCQVGGGGTTTGAPSNGTTTGASSNGTTTTRTSTTTDPK